MIAQTTIKFVENSHMCSPKALQGSASLQDDYVSNQGICDPQWLDDLHKSCERLSDDIHEIK